MELNETRFVVTGATGGIGLELTQQLAAAGATVVALGRDLQRLDDLAKTTGVTTISADLSSAAGRDEAARAILATGSIDAVIHGAGTQVLVDAVDPPPWSVVERELSVNLDAPVHLTHLLLPALLDRSNGVDEAAIVFITSGLALAPKASAAPYCATKAGLRSYSKALRHQLRDTPIRVVEALPPLVRTAMTEGRNEDGLEPAECARQILDGIEGNKTEIFVGRSRLLKLLDRWVPSLAERVMIDA